MGGKIHCQSKLGSGSTFWFTAKLPPAELPSSTKTTALRGMEEQLAVGTKVLLVEDNVINQKVGIRILESMGCKVKVAVNGRDCLEVLQQTQPEPFQIILMDCQMPEMDGFEATAHIRQMERMSNPSSCGRQQQSHIPIIALTASVTTDYKQKCLEIGMDDFLSKVNFIIILPLLVLLQNTTNAVVRFKLVLT